MSWFNSDSYNKGFNTGKEDAIAGRKRNILSLRAGLQSVIAFNSKVFQETYIKGYKEGYRTGLTLKTVNEDMKDKFHSVSESNLESNSARAEIKADRTKDPINKKLNNLTQNTQQNIFNSINSNSMQRGIDGQIDLLEQMKSFLSNLSEKFEEIIKTQEGFIRGLDSEGLDYKLLETFEDYLEENRNKVKGLIEGIENEEIPYTDRVIRHLEDTPR